MYIVVTTDRLSVACYQLSVKKICTLYYNDSAFFLSKKHSQYQHTLKQTLVDVKESSIAV